MGGMLGDVLSILLLCLVLAQFVALYLVYQRLSGAIVRSGAAQAAQADARVDRGIRASGQYAPENDPPGFESRW